MPPTPKHHYEVLDGLRGVAALLVVAFHIFEPNDLGNRFQQVINHGYLAVDFFFLLSGFVVSYAYDDRWPRMTLWDFSKRRLIRLQPMVVLGTLFGAALFFFGRGPAFPLIAHTPAWKLALVALLGSTLLPLPYQFDIRGWDEMHPLDGPCWSLFFEYLANLAYALGLRKLPIRALAALTALAAIFLTHMLLTGEGDAIGGWSLSAAQLHIGFARLCFPFLAGMLLQRSGFRLPLPRPLLCCSVLLVTSMALPRFGGPQHLALNGLYEAFCILLVFPLIVAIGASQQNAGPANPLCRILGDLSYPLYLIHYPLIYLYTAWMWLGPHTLAQRTAWGVALWLTAVLLAFLCLRLYDQPVRAALTRRFLHSPRIPGSDPALPSRPL
jgi:peptidoglycan/LPS O-acetylase OafA/YrhL